MSLVSGAQVGTECRVYMVFHGLAELQLPPAVLLQVPMCHWQQVLLQPPLAVETLHGSCGPASWRVAFSATLSENWVKVPCPACSRTGTAAWG